MAKNYRRRGLLAWLFGWMSAGRRDERHSPETDFVMRRSMQRDTSATDRRERREKLRRDR